MNDDIPDFEAVAVRLRLKALQDKLLAGIRTAYVPPPAVVRKSRGAKQFAKINERDTLVNRERRKHRFSIRLERRRP